VRICTIMLVMVISVIQSGYAEHTDLQEIQALNQLSEQMSGYIIWMSNRDGDWEIYRMDIDAGNIQQLTDNEVPDRGARISYDGKLIAWYRGDDRKRDVWIMNADGSEQRMLVADATVGMWRSDGKLVIHRGKDSDTSFLYDPATGEESKIWPPGNVKLKASDVRSTKPSPDGKLFVGWSSRPRGIWIFSADGKFQKHVHGGCEGRFAPDGFFIYWVMTAGEFGRATLKGEIQKPLYKIGEAKYGHTYFPSLSKDMKYLIFGACPNDQHDQDTSDYEIFLMKMENLKPAWNVPMRLTYDPGTDRWPDIFVRVDETPPYPPIYVEAEPHGQQVRLMWTDAQDAETKVVWYKIYRGIHETQAKARYSGSNERILAKVRDTIYVDRWTDAETSYYYKVSAVNAAGLESSRSVSATAKTSDPEPMAPVSLYATSAGSNRVRLTWASSPELDILGYNVYRSQKGRMYDLLNSKVVSEPIYVDSSVESGERYYYQVTAVDNSRRESDRSIPVLCTPKEYSMPDGLLALYLLDEGEGTAVHDRSGADPPLNLEIRDKSKVLWSKNSNGVEFIGSSMIVSNGNADRLFKDLRSSKGLSIEVWFSPANLSQTGPARIVSMSQDPGQRDFTVGQSGQDLTIRLRTTETSGNGIPELNTKNHVLSQRMTHLLTTYDGAVKRLYINGRLHSESQGLAGDFSTWENYPLIIGNELTGDRTWLGKVFLVAIYNRSLSADEVLRNYQIGI
jgi:hypothetical protein